MPLDTYCEVVSFGLRSARHFVDKRIPPTDDGLVIAKSSLRAKLIDNVSAQKTLECEVYLKHTVGVRELF